MGFKKSVFSLLGLSLLVSVIIGGIGSHYMMRNMDEAASQYENTLKPIVYMEEIEANYWRAHATLLQAALDRDPVSIRGYYNKVQAIYRQNKELIERYRASARFDPVGGALFRAFSESRDAYQEVNGQALEMVLNTTDDVSIADFTRFINTELQPVLRQYSASVDAMTAHILNMADIANEGAARNSRNALYTIIGIMIASGALLIGAGALFARSVIGMVDQVTGFAESMNYNRFDNAMDDRIVLRRDAFGTMARALNTMQGNFVTLLRDLRETAGVLAASREQAQKANESKTAFLARMSHEIRTPLNAIIGMTYIAQKAKDADIISDCLRKITTSSSLLLGIINDILDMSKIEAGKLELMEDEFSLEKLLMNVCTVVTVKTEEKSQELLVSLDPALSSRYIGDSLRLSQVLTNIINNATKFTPAKGLIRLAVSLHEKDSLFSTLVFTVEDSGIGMTEEQIGRLFTPFEQADGGTSRQFGGTGLGLAICKRIVGMMGGDIQVESEFGKGSRFIITVRLKNSGRLVRASLHQGIDPAKTTMLVVDGSPEARDFFEHLFSQLHIRLVTAESPAVAAKMLEQSGKPFDILFLDWSTAEAEGLDFVRKVKDRFGDQVIVILATSSKSAEIEEQAKLAGVNRFVQKPVFSSTLIDCINAVLGPEAIEERSVPERCADMSGRRVLLVEDVEINREIVFAYFGHTGLVMDVAENGADAVERYLADGGGYDLVLMDVHMPIMDGYTATRRIRDEERARNWPRKPIIAMTANAFKEDIERCLEAGMDDHIAKPMDPDEALRVLEKYLAPC